MTGTEPAEPWLVRKAPLLKTALRVLVGAVWGVDGALKFQPGFVASFAANVPMWGSGQPRWLAPWFAFWAGFASAHPAVVVDTIGALELALAFALIAGFARKTAYGGGLLLSLFIWAVPEGLGGPYGPSSTDVGTGVVYALVFFALLIFNAIHGPSRYSLDRWIERRWPLWARIAESRPLAAASALPAQHNDPSREAAMDPLPE